MPIKDNSYLDDIMDKYADRLLRVFQYYCSFGEPLNNNKLKSSKFLKFLKEGELLAKVTFRNIPNSRANENFNHQNQRA